MGDSERERERDKKPPKRRNEIVNVSGNTCKVQTL